MTIQIPKTFLTYCLGAICGGFVGAMIVLTAIGAWHATPPVLVLAIIVLIAWGLVSFDWGKP